MTATAHAICECGLGSFRRACVDHLLVVSEAHLQRVLNTHARYLNHTRPHPGRGQRLPEPQASAASTAGERRTVMALPVLGGLHHDDRRAA